MHWVKGFIDFLPNKKLRARAASDIESFLKFPAE